MKFCGFRIIRSIIIFLGLFSWAGAWAMDPDAQVTRASSAVSGSESPVLVIDLSAVGEPLPSFESARRYETVGDPDLPSFDAATKPAYAPPTARRSPYDADWREAAAAHELLPGSHIELPNFSKKCTVREIPAFPVYSLVFMPDSTKIAVGGACGAIRLIDSDFSREIDFAKTGYSAPGDEVVSLAFSSDRRMLAAARSTKKVIIYDVERGAILHEFKGYKDLVSSVAWREGNETLFTGSWDKKLCSYDMRDPRGNKFDVGLGISSLACDKTGYILVSGHLGGMQTIWDIRRMQQCYRWSGGTDVLLGPTIASIALNPSGSFAVAGTNKGRIKMWNLKKIDEEGAGHSTIEGLKGVVSAINFSDNGSFFVAGTHPGAVCTFDRHGKFLQQLHMRDGYDVEKKMLALALSRNGLMVIAGTLDGRLFRWQRG